ncbi:hypothetical protein BGX34_005101 [Mortierella sp. NVP85]|nr:hypothetical protein BGX34_005101 [Mortierella sp. NVP85]
MDQLKAEDVTKVWIRSKQKELNELERLEKQTLTKLVELQDRLRRLEGQEGQEEPVERKERLERLEIPVGLGDRRDPSRRPQEPKWAKSEEQRWEEQSILEGRGLSELMLKEPMGQEGQYHFEEEITFEEITFEDIDPNWSEQYEPFDEVDPPDPDVYEDRSDLSAMIYQASDPQPEPINDDDLRPGVPMAATSTMRRGDDDDNPGGFTFRRRMAMTEGSEDGPRVDDDDDDDDGVIRPRHPTEREY